MDAHARAMQNALTSVDAKEIAQNRDILAAHETKFSHRIKTKGISNQKRSGRCWMFAGFNTIKPVLMNNLDVGQFEFSHIYLQFWDKMEKANKFLEYMIDFRDRDLMDREVVFLLKHPCPDGGYWENFADLVGKYGVIPKEAMAETASSESTGMMNRMLDRVLRKHATELRETTPMLVYPRVEPVANRVAFAGLVERAGTEDRDAFDRLREYSSGDALRDINWKASAKRPDGEFVVTEFAAQERGGISIVAESGVGYADEMATAAASVAGYLLDADLLVDVAVPGGELEEGRGEEHRGEMLELLARTGAGRVTGSRADRADVYVFADEDGTRVRVRDTVHPFESLIATDGSASVQSDREDPLETGVTA